MKSIPENWEKYKKGFRTDSGFYIVDFVNPDMIAVFDLVTNNCIYYDESWDDIIDFIHAAEQVIKENKEWSRTS